MQDRIRNYSKEEEITTSLQNLLEDFIHEEEEQGFTQQKGFTQGKEEGFTQEIKNTPPFGRKKNVFPKVPTAVISTPSSTTSSSPTPWMMMPAKPDLKSVFPNLMRT